MRLSECEVNDIIRFTPGGGLWQVYYKDAHRVKVHSLSGAHRIFYKKEDFQVINLTKSEISVPVKGTLFERDWR